MHPGKRVPLAGANCMRQSLPYSGSLKRWFVSCIRGRVDVRNLQMPGTRSGGEFYTGDFLENNR